MNDKKKLRSINRGSGYAGTCKNSKYDERKV